MPADLAVIGLGAYGLPLAQAAVAAGISTIGYRTGPEAGSLSPAELRRMLSGGFRPTTDPAELGRVRTAVICAPTPRGADGGLDLSQLEAAARTLAAHLRPHTTVILESPVYPGATEEFLRPLLEEGSGLRAGRDFHLAYSPSRVDPGNRDVTPATTPKVIGGLTPACTESAAAFHARLTDKVVRARGPREAETVQLLETNYRHVNIALVNEMAVLCNDLGVDLWDVIRCAETKPFGFQAFRPGPGVGGHSVPQDMTTGGGRGLRMVELAQEVNNRMPGYVVQRAATLLNEHGKSARGARVLLLGVTYKPDLADLQGTPAQEIALRLLELGASVSYHDPHVPCFREDGKEYRSVSLTPQAVSAADCVMIVTDHSLIDYGMIRRTAQLVVDTRNALSRGA